MRLNITPEPAILGFLLDRPVHGYDLYKQVNQDLGVVWRVSLSQLYAIIKTFETRGWIETHVRTQDARPSQKLLEITPSGRQAFADWSAQPAHGLREFRVDFFLRLYFARLSGHPFAEHLIGEQIAACERELKDLKADCAGAGSEEDELAQLARSFRIQQMIGITTWLENHLSQLSQPPSPASTPHRTRITRRSSSRPSLQSTAPKHKKQ